MVSQEEKAIVRIKKVHQYIKAFDNLKAEDVYAWAQVNLGIRERTTATYLRALANMGAITIEGQIVKDVKKDV